MFFHVFYAIFFESKNESVFGNSLGCDKGISKITSSYIVLVRVLDIGMFLFKAYGTYDFVCLFSHLTGGAAVDPVGTPAMPRMVHTTYIDILLVI